MNTVGWVFVLLCVTNFLIAGFARENSEKSRDFLISSMSDLQEHAENMTLAVKGQRGGRASSGGSNVVHQRPPGKSAAAVLYGPYDFFISSTSILAFGFSLLLAYPED